MPTIYVTEYAVSLGIEMIEVSDEVLQMQDAKGAIFIYSPFDQECEDGDPREIEKDEWHTTLQAAIERAKVKILAN